MAACGHIKGPSGCRNKKKKTIPILWVFLSLLSLHSVTTTHAWCLEESYPAEDIALEAATSDDQVEVRHLPDQYHYAFKPLLMPLHKVGFIFYTGYPVEELAYAPLMRAMAEHGYPCFLIESPCDASTLAPLRASRVVNKYDFIKKWVVGGHSNGGFSASWYARWYPSSVHGLVLLSSFPFPLVCNLRHQHDLPAVSLWGSLDGIVSRQEWENSRHRLPPNATLVEIHGGNHAQMGYYGDQDGDNHATLSRAQQQFLVKTEILALLESLSQPDD